MTIFHLSIRRTGNESFTGKSVQTLNQPAMFVGDRFSSSAVYLDALNQKAAKEGGFI
jgi:hypothetical protein